MTYNPGSHDTARAFSTQQFPSDPKRGYETTQVTATTMTSNSPSAQPTDAQAVSVPGLSLGSTGIDLVNALRCGPRPGSGPYDWEIEAQTGQSLIHYGPTLEELIRGSEVSMDGALETFCPQLPSARLVYKATLPRTAMNSDGKKVLKFPDSSTTYPNDLENPLEEWVLERREWHICTFRFDSVSVRPVDEGEVEKMRGKAHLDIYLAIPQPPGSSVLRARRSGC